MASKLETKIGPQRQTSFSADEKPPRSGIRFVFLILIALMLFAGATYFAFQQEPKPNPYTQPTFWESVYYPLEKNAFMRLPIINGRLNDIFVLPNGEKLWAVGNQGLIVHSSDGGKTWKQQRLPITEQFSQSSSIQPFLPAVIQRNVATQLFFQPINFSLFSEANAASKPAKEDWQQNTQQSIGAVDQKIQATDTQQQQQPLKQVDDTPQQPEQVIVEEEPASQEVLPNLNAVHFVNEKIGFIVGDKGIFLKTIDGGNEWQVLSTDIDENLNAVTFLNDGLNGWAVGDKGRIILTDDGGNRWQPIPLTRQQRNNLHAVAFANDGQRGWAVGDKGMALSTVDGGQRWQMRKNITNSDLVSIELLIDGRVGRIVERSGKAFLTYDDGKAWTVQTRLLADKKNLAVFASDKRQGWLIDSGSTIVATADGGEYWFPQTSQSHYFNDVVFRDDNSAWVVGSRGIVLSSHDGGSSWEPQTSRTNKNLNAITFLNDNQRGWAVGGDAWLSADAIFQGDGPGIVLSTDNGGQSWNVDNHYDSVLNSIEFAENNRSGWITGDSGRLLTTTDQGKSWQPKRPEQLAFDAYSDIAFTADGQKGWLLRNFNSRVLFSDDGGKSWQPKIQNIRQSLFSLAISDDGQSAWVVGTSGAIIRAENRGERWDIQPSNTNRHLSSIVFSSDGLSGWIVGDKGTVLSSDDGGNSWRLEEKLVNTDLNAIAIAENSRKGIIVGESQTILYSHDAGQTWQHIQYSRTVAYWFWLLCFGFFGLAFWLMTKKPKEVSSPEETVADLLASDKPLEPGDPDPLNFNAISLGLSRFMRNPATEPPLTVAITGAWGSGKSSLMNLLYHDLKSYGFTPVWFNAWHHQKGEQLLASLYANIKEQAIPGWFKFYKLMPVGLIFRLNLLAKRIKNHWLLTLVSLVLTVFVFRFVIDTGFSWADLSPKNLLDSFIGEANGSVENLLILILGGPIAILIRWLQAFGISPEKLMTNRNGNKKDSTKVDPSARQAFAKEFKDVSSCLDTGRMVIFIDDLDRCSKENVVDILEAMNFLSVSGDCYIVVGMDETWVKICIENNFPDMVKRQQSAEFSSNNEKSFADNYLEKMINIPVPIPTLKETDAIDLLLPQDNASPPISMLGKVSLLISSILIRYRVVFSLVAMAVVIGAITAIIPSGIFSAVEEKQVKAEIKQRKIENLYEWNNISLERFSMVDGKPEIRLSTVPKNDKEQSGSDEGELQLVLEGNPDLLEKGLTIATLGDKNVSADLVLKQVVTAKKTEAKQELSIESSRAEQISTEESIEPEKAELLSGNEGMPTNDFWLPLLSLALFIFGFIVYSLKIPNRFVEDSPHFKDALAIWQPWISLQRSTPRAIKRYVNYVRYLAMRYKSPELDLHNQQGLSGLFSNEENQSSLPYDINEENLVALSAIYAIEPTWLTDAEKFSKLKEGYIQDMIESKFKTTIAYEENDQYKQLSESLRSSIDRHKKKFGANAFNESIVERFLDINTNTKFN